MLQWLSVSLLMRLVRKSEGPVFTTLPPLAAPLSAIAQQQPQCALFYLLLSQLCLYLDTKEFPVSAHTTATARALVAPAARTLMRCAVVSLSCAVLRCAS